MAIHNSILLSAAYAGFLQAQQGEITGDIASLRAQALTFATAVDAAVPADVAISAAGAQIAAAFTTGGGSCKTNLLQNICAAVMAGRNPVGNVPASYTAIATAINLLYQAAVLDQTIP